MRRRIEVRREFGDLVAAAIGVEGSSIAKSGRSETCQAPPRKNVGTQNDPAGGVHVDHIANSAEAAIVTAAPRKNHAANVGDAKRPASQCAPAA